MCPPSRWSCHPLLQQGRHCPGRRRLQKQMHAGCDPECGMMRDDCANHTSGIGTVQLYSKEYTGYTRCSRRTTHELKSPTDTLMLHVYGHVRRQTGRMKRRKQPQTLQQINTHGTMNIHVLPHTHHSIHNSYRNPLHPCPHAPTHRRGATTNLSSCRSCCRTVLRDARPSCFAGAAAVQAIVADHACRLRQTPDGSDGGDVGVEPHGPCALPPPIGTHGPLHPT